MALVVIGSFGCHGVSTTLSSKLLPLTCGQDEEN
jgi:hypothetical protein